MSLFSLDIQDILSAPFGTSEVFTLEREIPDDTFTEVVCRTDLVMRIKLVRQKYGIECVIESLSTSVDVPAEALEDIAIDLHTISREFHEKKLPDDTDDIRYIDHRELMIDLLPVIEEELLIAAL